LTAFFAGIIVILREKMEEVSKRRTKITKNDGCAAGCVLLPLLSGQ
jgi:hypothetical protein